MNAKHTATPWTVNGGYIVGVSDPENAETVVAFGDGTRPSDADAAFIETAVNAHDDLVAALRGLMGRFESTGEAWMHDHAMIQARAALSKAEEA